MACSTLTTANLYELSALALVACDASYKGPLAAANEPLQAFHDTPQYGNPGHPFPTDFQVYSGNYVVDRTFENAATGFKAIAYRDAVTNDVLMAFAGTDGPDGKDWWTNTFHVGWNQWAAGREEVLGYLSGRAAQGDNIHFTGQSLGGGLAQFAAYEFMVANSSYDKNRLSLITFNALGGVSALQEKTSNFNPGLVNGFRAGVHYVVANDIVHRLGEGHIGGSVREFDWSDAARPAPYNRLDFIDAHRIESAFYGYLSGASNTLSLGGGIDYDDVRLEKDGDDLIVNTGGDDQLVFKDWYGGKDNVLNLQLILDASAAFDATSQDPLYNRRVQTFDFRAMVAAFDQEREGNPGLSSWAITNALLAAHLEGSDDEALGGDLAYWYGRNGAFAGIGLQSAMEVLGSSGFGADAQTLRPFNGLQEGFTKLT